MHPGTLLGWLLVLLAVAGCGYTVVALVAVERFARTPAAPDRAPRPVTLLKPLHGGEPRLADNLRAALDQDWPAPIQLVAGVQRGDDPALDAVAALPTTPTRTVTRVCDDRRHGANAKVGNLLNMLPAADADTLILSDSDMAVPRDYVARVVAALDAPGVGAVTCVYAGRGDAGGWSRLAAAGLTWQFLPNVLASRMLGDRRACMGSTIAIRAETLDAIGGLAALKDTLADDHAIGAGVRALGLTVAVPPIVLLHASCETSFAALVRHELRWAATLRDVVSAAEYAGSALTLPLPFALAALPLLPGPAMAAIAAALAVRMLLAIRLDRLAGHAPAPLWWLPARDLLSFGLFAASWCVRSVDWRGARLTMIADGRIAPPPGADRS